MTIVVSIKVHDGIVLSADSASTLSVREANGTERTLNVWNNQNKLFNLRKGLPIGGITYGHGAIGHASISTLSKDLRVRLTTGDAHWKLDPDNYTMEEVAEKTRRFLFEERFLTTYGGQPEQPGMLGYWVAGYSAGAELGEVWDVSITNGQCDQPRRVRPMEESGANWGGDPEVVSRIVLGRSQTLPKALESLGMDADAASALIGVIDAEAHIDLVWPQMPIQDAIDLADFLVCSAISFARFRPGAETIGGPVEIAAITKHEGFKWVKRKHYFTGELNRIPSLPEHKRAVA